MLSEVERNAASILFEQVIDQPDVRKVVHSRRFQRGRYVVLGHLEPIRALREETLLLTVLIHGALSIQARSHHTQ